MAPTEPGLQAGSSLSPIRRKFPARNEKFTPGGLTCDALHTIFSEGVSPVFRGGDGRLEPRGEGPKQARGEPHQGL